MVSKYLDAESWQIACPFHQCKYNLSYINAPLPHSTSYFLFILSLSLCLSLSFLLSLSSHTHSLWYLCPSFFASFHPFLSRLTPSLFLPLSHSFLIPQAPPRRCTHKHTHAHAHTYVHIHTHTHTHDLIPGCALFSHQRQFVNEYLCLHHCIISYWRLILSIDRYCKVSIASYHRTWWSFYNFVSW